MKMDATELIIKYIPLQQGLRLQRINFTVTLFINH